LCLQEIPVGFLFFVADEIPVVRPPDIDGNDALPAAQPSERCGRTGPIHRPADRLRLGTGACAPILFEPSEHAIRSDAAVCRVDCTK